MENYNRQHAFPSVSRIVYPNILHQLYKPLMMATFLLAKGFKADKKKEFDRFM